MRPTFQICCFKGQAITVAPAVSKAYQGHVTSTQQHLNSSGVSGSKCPGFISLPTQPWHPALCPPFPALSTDLRRGLAQITHLCKHPGDHSTGQPHKNSCEEAECSVLTTATFHRPLHLPEVRPCWFSMKVASHFVNLDSLVRVGTGEIQLTPELWVLLQQKSSMLKWRH